MKKYLLMLTFIFPVLIVISACGLISGLGSRIRGSGNLKTETRQVSGFDGVSVCCGMRLTLTQGRQESLEIEAEDNILPEIVSEVQGSVLTIHFKDATSGLRITTTKPILVRVSAINLKSLEVSGGGSADAGAIDTSSMAVNLSGGSRAELQALKSDSLNADLSGSGSLTLPDAQVARVALEMSGGSQAQIDHLEGDSLKLDGSGGGKMTVAGKVKDLTASLAGGVDLGAGNLECQTARIEMSGGGTSVVWATETLNVLLSGGATVEYYGTPAITQDLSGGSKLVSRGEK
jgi:hypothetical protein